MKPEQEKFIKKSYRYLSDIEIGKKISMSSNDILQYRILHSLRRTNNELFPGEPGYDENKKSDIKSQLMYEFKNSEQFKILQKSLTDDELQYYFDELSKYCEEIESVGESITSSERRALDQLIQTQISINRFNAIQKDINESLPSITDTAKRTALENRLEFVSRELRGLRDVFLSFQKSLEMTKQERTKKSTSAKLNVLTLVNELKDAKTREGVGAWTSLSAKAIKNVLRDWRIKSILVDSESIETNDDTSNT